MGIVGCGFMFTGLLLGALSGSVALCLSVVGIGVIFAFSAYAQEQRKERQAQEWRKNYPSYKY